MQMDDDTSIAATSPVRFTAAELAALIGDPIERIEQLRGRGIIEPDADGRYPAGDVHRIRVIDGFEAAGVPLDVLIAAQDAGLISVDYYDDLHVTPGQPSERRYDAYRASLGETARILPSLFDAFGLAVPDATSHLTRDEERLLERIADIVEVSGQADLALRILRQFGEATRRASAAALEVYAEVIERVDPAFSGVPSREIYDEHFLPWARFARSAPEIAGWLTARHMTGAIDDYSIRTTEQVLEDAGYVPRRPDEEPVVAFLDLTGFTQLTQEAGDASAADIALRLADLARVVATDHGGRVVKLLGDGVLLRFGGLVAAVEATLILLDRLPSSGLPPGHVGITQGPVVARDGDIFGRVVNLAARISDVAPSGEVYLPASVGVSLADRFRVEPVASRSMAGIGVVDLVRVSRG
jgi:adenylate cyclase